MILAYEKLLFLSVYFFLCTILLERPLRWHFFEFVLILLNSWENFTLISCIILLYLLNKLSEKNHFQLTSFLTIFSVLIRVADWFQALLMSSDYVWKIIFSVIFFGENSNIIHEIRVKFSQEFNKNKINSKKCHLRGLLSKIVHRKKYTERKSDFSYASIICPE